MITDAEEDKLHERITALRQALIAVTKCRPHPLILDAQLAAQNALDEDDYAAGRPRKK